MSSKENEDAPAKAGVGAMFAAAVGELASSVMDDANRLVHNVVVAARTRNERKCDCHMRCSCTDMLTCLYCGACLRALRQLSPFRRPGTPLARRVEKRRCCLPPCRYVLCPHPVWAASALRPSSRVALLCTASVQHVLVVLLWDVPASGAPLAARLDRALVAAGWWSCGRVERSKRRRWG